MNRSDILILEIHDPMGHCSYSLFMFST